MIVRTEFPMNRLAICAFAVLLVAEGTLGTASAQRRGGGGAAGSTGRMARGNAAPSPARTGPAARPPSATPRSTFVMRPQRHVVVAPIYPGLYPGFYSPYAYPPFYSGPSYGGFYPEPYTVVSSQSENHADLAYELERLTREVERLRQDQFNASPQPPPPPAPLPPPPSPPPAAQPPAKPIILVFRDGHRLKIQNYAVVRESLWVLDDATRIALNDLDVDATHQANPGRVLLLAAK